jgi:MFS-type transporter involved in bile tolerance (Atg22 family)
MLPVAGAMVDYSNHRKGVILKSFMVFWVANLLQGFLNERTWFLAIVLQSVFCVTTYMIHNTFVLSYYTEVVTDVEFQLPKLNATLRVYEMSGMLGFMILSTVVSRGAAMDIFATARFGQFFACALAVVPFFFGSKLLEERKAVHTRPEGLNLFTVGFAKVGKTMAMLNKDFHDCRNVLVAIMFFESANSNVVTTSTTYITQQLKIENPAPILTFIILMTIPGALICNRFVQKLGPLKACASCVALNMVTGAVTVLFVTSPETSGRIFITGALYGLGIGSTYPLQRNLFQSLMPFGHESELMGTLSFMGNIIGWLPSLLFSVLNEVTGNLRLA